MAMLKKCLGVDLGSNTVKVVEMSADRKNLKILTVASAETNIEPTASVEDRRAAIVKALKDLLKRNKVSCKEAVFALPGQKVFIRRFRLPETSTERLDKIVAFEARQQIPFPIEKTDLQWQFFPIPEDREVEVLLVAVRHDEVREFMSLVDKTGLKPVAVAVSSFALFNTQTFLQRSPDDVKKLVEDLGAKKKKPTKKKGVQDDETAVDQEDDFVFEEVKGFVNIGAAAMDLAIAQLGQQPLLKFSRSVPSAGNDVTRAIMSSCKVSNFQDAERIKKHQCKLMTFDFDFEVDGSINNDACKAATHAVDRIISELRRSLDFFISQPDGMAVDSLVISGGQSMLSGMASYIEEKLSVPVTLTEEFEEGFPLAWPGGVLSEQVVAFGLALQGVGLGSVAVDFLPTERKITRDFPYRSTAIMVVLLLGAVAVSSQAGKNYIAQFEQQKTVIEGQLSLNQSGIARAMEAQQRHSDLAAKVEDFSKGINDRGYWMEFLTSVSEVKPSDVLVNQITCGFDGSIRIVGVSELQRSAADFNNALRDLVENPLEIPELVDVVPVPGERVGMPGKPQVFRFVITLKTSDKVNRLEVTPTPEPASEAGARGGNSTTTTRRPSRRSAR